MSNFTIRVYGILRNDRNQILVSDEFIRGVYVTKFPGGGLEYGEGTRDCLRREFMEETGLEITVGDHFYTTDFFQQSGFAFNKEQQVMSIYYLVKCKVVENLNTHVRPFDFTPEQTADPNGQIESFRWIAPDDLTEESVTLPIDKVVVKQLLSVLSVAQPKAKNYFIQSHPFVVPTTDGKLIEEHFGAAATGHKNVSIAHMVAPPGWSEPFQTPEFNEWTIIISGKKWIEIDGEKVEVTAGQSILVFKGAKVKYANPFSEPCEYWSVCIPAFSMDKVHRTVE